MARTGLYQSEVKKARDALVAQGKHPSVDSVRVALGNTGSKTTIHKYLKELEAAGVDLILTGHSHVYERSPLINGHYGKSPTFDAAKHVVQKGSGREGGDGAYRKKRGRIPNAGEVSVVTGSAGHAGSKPPALNHPVFYIAMNEAGSSVIDVDGLRLDLTFITDKGEKKDWFSIIKE